MLRWSALIVTTALAASSAAAQAVCSRDNGEANFDFVTLDCLQCVVHPSGRDVWIEYGAEPVVHALTTRDTPLRVGDVIVSVDGSLITTPTGSRRLAHPGANPIRFTVRRDGRAVDVTVRPASGCATAIVQQSLDLQDHLRLVRQRDSAASGAGGGGAVGAGGGRVGRTWQFQFGTNIGNDSTNGRILALRPGSIIDTVFERSRDRNDSTRVIIRGHVDSMIHELHLRFDTLHVRMKMSADSGRTGRMSFTIQNDSGVLRRIDTISGRMLQQMAQRVRATTGGGAIGGALVGSSSRGWIGFGVDCGDCMMTTEANGERVWHFEHNPAIAGVDPDGPADIAGVLAGDILRSIDGMAITSNEGGRRFSALQPGQKVRLTVERRGRSVDLVITAGRRPN